MRSTAGHRLFDACNYLLMIALSITFLYPLLNVAATSVSSGMRVVAGTIGVIPVDVDLTAYRIAMRNPMLLRGYGNSIFYAGAGTVANLVLISLAAYPLSKRHLVFRGPISFFIAFTLLFSGGLIPTFLLVKSLGLYNTRAWIIATQFYHVFFIVMLRTFYQQLPSSLEDAAKIVQLPAACAVCEGRPSAAGHGPRGRLRGAAAVPEPERPRGRHLPQRRRAAGGVAADRSPVCNPRPRRPVCRGVGGRSACLWDCRRSRNRGMAAPMALERLVGRRTRAADRSAAAGDGCLTTRRRRVNLVGVDTAR